MRMHALDATETFLNRIGNFYFRVKIMILGNFEKIQEKHRNLWFLLTHVVQGGRPPLAPEEREEPERRWVRCAGAPQASQSPEACQGCCQCYPYRFAWRLEVPR